MRFSQIYFPTPVLLNFIFSEFEEALDIRACLDGAMKTSQITVGQIHDSLKI